MNSPDTAQAVEERQILLRESLMLQKIERGYMGLGIWQHDLDYPEVHHQPVRREVRFRSVDRLTLAEGEQMSTKDEPLPTSRFRVADATAPENFGRNFPTMSRVVSVHYSLAWERREDPRDELVIGPFGLHDFAHGSGEVFEVLLCYGGLWWVRRPIRGGYQGWVWRRDFARLE